MRKREGSGLKTVSIRPAMLADAADLSRFVRQNFIDTYAEQSDPENMRIHCDTYFGLAQQTAEILDPDGVVLLAYCDDELVGIAQVVRRPPPECVQQPQALGLFRYYVQKDWHGKGVAKVLLDSVLASAEQMNGKHLWLTVWEHNPRAIAFYQKMGFTKVGLSDYTFGSEVQTDFVLLKVLAK